MKAPTAIQKNTIPQLVKGDADAFLQAETGSGKTLAYLLPIVHRIMALSRREGGEDAGGTGAPAAKVHRNSGLFAIVLAPTRELCKQIATVLERVLHCAPWLVSTTVIGGESKKSEKGRIRKGVNILIATPGRLVDHLDNTKVLNVGTVRWLVLDEGDRMMEMGFEEDLRTIIAKIRADKLQKRNGEGLLLDGALPTRRVTVLCSATMKMKVQRLGEISLDDAVHITASSLDAEKEATSGANVDDVVFAAPAQLKQICLVVPAKLRLVTLIALLKSTFARKGSVMKAIIFFSCADSVNYHFELLKKNPGKPTPAREELSSSPEPSPQPKKASPHTGATVSPALYMTSPANPTITLHKLHGSLAQPVRTSTLQAFASCPEPAVLVTTDIASRGLDVPAVELVVEYDPAFVVSDHVHRIGRTARAGRPGKAILFLQPGCEEGYVSLLQPSTSALTPQLYDSILQRGLATNVDLPAAKTSSTDTSGATEKQTWTTRAEALQLHFEQRLLAPAEEGESRQDAGANLGPSKGSKFKKGQRPQKQARDSHLLDAARLAFRSHIRAYATHVREERGFFDMTQLHLGHLTKSFGLREAPGGIGGGVSRRVTGSKRVAGSVATIGGGGGGGGFASGQKRRFGDGEDDDGPSRNNGLDEAVVRRMQVKMKVVMNPASEFNIG